MNILLLGANERAAFSFAKTFYQQGFTVTIINDVLHPIRYSKFIKKFITINFSFEKETDKSVAEIILHLQQNNYQVLIPVHDVALTICQQFKDQLSAHIKMLYINDDETQIFCSNKFALYKFYEQQKMPVPSSTIINTIDDLKNLPELRFPCIAKPVSSKVYITGKIFSYTIKKMNTKEELIDFIREKIESVSIMVQELLGEGFGGGYNFLALNGQVINAYAHLRINEAYGGGQSTYRKTIAPSQYNIEAYSKKIISQIKWTGIAMIEYRIVNNIAYIMEINGRGWGSMELGIFAGCNLPVDMINTLYYNQPVLLYKFINPVFARNLFNEFSWALQSRSLSFFLKWIVSLKSAFRSDNIIEDNLFTDFNFRLGYAVESIGSYFSRTFKRIIKKIIPLKIPVLSNKNISADKKIAIVCKGNINRSAFAEQYILQRIERKYQINSYGTVFEENRLSPINAIKAAQEFNISMEQHRSKYLDKQSIDKTDIFIIMDKDNFNDIRGLGVPKNKIFFLAKYEIPDPYKKDISFYKKNFVTIAKNIQQIFE